MKTGLLCIVALPLVSALSLANVGPVARHATCATRAGHVTAQLPDWLMKKLDPQDTMDMQSPEAIERRKQEEAKRKAEGGGGGGFAMPSIPSMPSMPDLPNPIKGLPDLPNPFSGPS